MPRTKKLPPGPKPHHTGATMPKATARIPVDSEGLPDESGQSLEAAVCAAFWTLRNRLENFSVLVTNADAESFARAAEHMEQEPKIKVEKVPSGLIVQMVDQRGAPFAQAESSTADQEKKERTQALKLLLSQVPVLIQQSQALENMGSTSSDLNAEIRQALADLRRALL